jgi:hypothetical protein
MTRRSLPLIAGFVLGLTPVVGQQPTQPTNPPGNSKPTPIAPTVEIYGSLVNPALMSAAPASGVIVTETAWTGLARAWEIKNPPKVDFKKEFLVVGTSRADKMILDARKDMAGDVRVTVTGNGKEFKEGFRFGVRSVSRDGVKTVNGKPLPPE